MLDIFAFTRLIVPTRRLVALTGAALLVASPLSIAAGDQGAAPSGAATGGHCSFNLKNAWAGPFKACVDPASAAQCAELGKKDENSGAVHGAGSCPASGRAGTCAKPDGNLHYYEGDPSSLEIGCGFQGGTWKTGS